MLPPVWNYPFTYRAVKGSPLSNDEVDDNFKAVAERAEYAQTVAETLPNEIALTAADAATYTANQIAQSALATAQAAAADAAAVVTGGTATLTPEAGKIPLAGGSGYIDNGWINPTLISGISGAIDTLRQDLADPDMGAAMVGHAGRTAADYFNVTDSSIIFARGSGEGVDGTATLQEAIDVWAANPNRSIEVIGTLDVQGTVTVPNKETDNPEKRLTIRGGALLKKNAGYMFTRPPGQSVPDGMGGTLQLQTGHITFDGVRFLGPRTTAGAYILDGDNVIRTKFVNCYGDGIQIAYAAQYLQSIYVDTASVFRKWSGWLFDCGYLFDVKFYGAAEAGESFMRTRDVAADPAANSLAVRGVIEGLSGKVFEIGVCFGVVIDGNYQEANAGGDYDFSIGTGYHKGLTLIGNGFQPSTVQLADPNYYPVKLGKGAVNSITLIGNSSTGNLFDVPNTNQSAIIDIGNWCPIGKKRFSRVVREFSFSDPTECRFRLTEGIGVGLHSYYQKFGFESTRATVAGETITAGVTTGATNPGTNPSGYAQKNWVAGTFVLNSAPSIGLRQYGAGTVRDALILGWVCMTSGTPGTWREIPVMLPF